MNNAQQLTNEQLVLSIRSGHREHIALLWTSLRWYIRKQAAAAAKLYPPSYGITAEDLEQSAFPAMLDAVRTFDSSTGASFIGWLKYYLQRAFRDCAGIGSSKRDALQLAVSLDAPLPNSTEETESSSRMHELVACVDETSERAYEQIDEAVYHEQLHAVLDAEIEKLPPACADVVRRRYWCGQTHKEIAELYHEQPSTVAARERQAMEHLRRKHVQKKLRRFVEESCNYYVTGGKRNLRPVESILEHLERARAGWTE